MFSLRMLMIPAVAMLVAVPGTLRADAGAQTLLASDEFPHATSAVARATATYFESLEIAPDAGALVPGAVAASSASLESAEMMSLKADLGPVRQLTAYRLTWYPVENLIAAVDYVATYSDGEHLVCGYLLWDLSDTDKPELKRVEANYLDSDELRNLAPETAGVRLLEANCAYPVIDANFALFKP